MHNTWHYFLNALLVMNTVFVKLKHMVGMLFFLNSILLSCDLVMWHVSCILLSSWKQIQSICMLIQFCLKHLIFCQSSWIMSKHRNVLKQSGCNYFWFFNHSGNVRWSIWAHCILGYSIMFCQILTIYSSQHLKKIQKVNQSCPKTRTHFGFRFKDNFDEKFWST